MCGEVFNGVLGVIQGSRVPGRVLPGADPRILMKPGGGRPEMAEKRVKTGVGRRCRLHVKHWGSRSESDSKMGSAGGAGNPRLGLYPRHFLASLLLRFWLVPSPDFRSLTV